jgi:succinate dehydrogenase/fumarate reductase flavoprotein subunit
MRTLFRFLILALSVPALFGANAVLSTKANPGKPAPGMSVKPAGIAPQDEIKAAAASIAQNPAPSLGGARSAALNLLATHRPGYTNTDVENLMVVLLQQAAKENDAELRARMGEMKRKNADKEALRKGREAAKESRDNPKDASIEDQHKLQDLQNRREQIQRVLSGMTKKSAGTASKVSQNLK